MREWQQDDPDSWLKSKHTLAAHFLDDSVLLTVRWSIPGNNIFVVNQEVTFQATLEQSADIANSILSHVASKKIVET